MFQRCHGRGSTCHTATEYGATPAGPGQTTLSLLETIAPLPSNFEIGVTLNSPAGIGGLYSKAMLIVDYRHANDYKYVGAFTGARKWRFGRYLNGSFLEERILPDPNLAPDTDFVVDLLVEGSGVTLMRDGVEVAIHDFGAPLRTGQVGLGSRNAIAEFDDLNLSVVQTVNAASSISKRMATFNAITGIGKKYGSQQTIFHPHAQWHRESHPLKVDSIFDDSEVPVPK